MSICFIQAYAWLLPLPLNQSTRIFCTKVVLLVTHAKMFARVETRTYPGYPSPAGFWPPSLLLKRSWHNARLEPVLPTVSRCSCKYSMARNKSKGINRICHVLDSAGENASFNIWFPHNAMKLTINPFLIG